MVVIYGFMLILAVAYFLLFTCVALHNFRWAIFAFILLLPSYLIRFDVFYFKKIVFPSTVLELSFGAIFLVWLIKYSRTDWSKIWAIAKKHIWFFVAFDLFFISSVVSIFVSDMPIPSLGEWRAFFLEPMIFFLILIGRKEIFKTKDLFLALAFSTLSISVFAVAQKFTGWGIATPEWSAAATRRVTAFFSSPNAVGLYLAPVFMLIVAVIASYGRDIKGLLRRPSYLGIVATALFCVLAITFTKSQGTWIGLGAGMLTFLFFVDYKKLAIALAVAGAVFALVVPSMRQAVLFQDQANQNRLRLWGYSWTFLEASPKNFVLGTGVRQFFRKIQKPYYDKYVMERLIYPHNIFLNFWTEIGLVGMLAVMGVLAYVFCLANRIRKNNKLIGAGLMSALVVLVVHGLVDVPYFKNDLAFLFWILMTTVFILYENIYKSEAELIRG
ncbi:MAG: hypothetical protein A2534_00195 [Candidatus Magasanikbacteria bacterium RIFOXYD2_FULL_39_9]|uniref:O-antigen ligase-related domain-containing protein n=1 Tax=Candidatus Magasanikbacteria bacterium RIFOXYD1_FULL_40_23 TaxID=1798705 RepID=A0A1F6P9H3_9BACT|nr:MAG: hypothetical protein A2563_02915 [Candidatus Magasanikbacteria bacterium RIFOXYD1_FULL_40_23]OGH93565.1 MAG: hypothetical protein A2534_00195 [Candidatus Magasanikbacteria bacterium RIFOXYD2_FULL_39_9]